MTELDKIIEKICPKHKKAISEHKLTYDSSTETLEPVYFWILDNMNAMFGGKVKKLIDNFASSPGSGHFSELQGKSSQMQQEASRVLGTVNNILKGIINLIYDLKEFQIRLKLYEQAGSKDKSEKEAGILALKQTWMDKVDVLRGVGSINSMTSGNLNFVTLRDAFLSVKSVQDVETIDINERVKRILKPRLQEFFEWKTKSELELKKRYEIEKSYLKSQVAALKLNTRWAKPYLKAARRLTQNEKLSTDPSLVNVFNTLILELTLWGEKGLDIADAVISKDLPREFLKIKNVREYKSVVVVDFNFRGIPSKMGQHYTFGGVADVTFKSYVFNSYEIELIMNELDKSDIEEAFSLVEEMTQDSLAQIKLDIDDILEEGKKEEKEKQKLQSEDINPFSAIFEIFKPEKKIFEKKQDPKEREKELKQKLAKPENYYEKYLRALAEFNAINTCYTIYDVYKKAHGMASFPYGGALEYPKMPDVKFKDIF